MRKLLIVSTALCLAAVAQDNTYKPGVTYQKTNPNYPAPNPFYFEGRVDWDLLKIDQIRPMPGNSPSVGSINRTILKTFRARSTIIAHQSR